MASPADTLSFVPCVEDAPRTRQIGRHPAVFQRTLDAASYAFLRAQSRLAKDPHSPHARLAYQETLTEEYRRLWQQRSLVPKAARREWFETVTVYLHALDALEGGLLWLMDHIPLAEETMPKSKEGATDLITVDHAPSSSIAGGTEPSQLPTPSADPAPQRKQPKGKKLLQDAAPLWYLWQDAQRHLHHLTLRLHAWTPASGGAYATREALRGSDLVRMDSSAFTWRVRLWTRVSCRILATPSTMSSGAAETSDSENRGDASFSVKLLEQLRTALSSVSPLFAEEEPELLRVLTALYPAAPLCGEEAEMQARVAGALLYRMFIEVALVRLRALPRCIFTWRLLHDVVKSSATLLRQRSSAHTTTAAVLSALVDYIESILVPYVEQRDCHLGNVRHSATDIHAHFTRLSKEKMSELYPLLLTAASRSGGGDGSHAVSLPFPESDDRPAGEQRLEMCTAMVRAVHDVCGCASDTESCDVVEQNILGNGSVDANADDADKDQHFTEDFVDLQMMLRAKRVEEQVLYSHARRTSQLTVFFYHYFTQSPTMAFDRVSRGGTVTDASSTNGDSHEQ